MKYFLVCLVLFKLILSSESFGFGGAHDIGGHSFGGHISGRQSSGGRNNIASPFPGAGDFFEMGKNVIADYPFAHVTF